MNIFGSLEGNQLKQVFVGEGKTAWEQDISRENRRRPDDLGLEDKIILKQNNPEKKSVGWMPLGKKTLPKTNICLP